MFSHHPTSRNMTLGLAIITLALTLVTVGCESWPNRRKFGLPSFAKPGTANEQMERAVRFDPYPTTDVGPETGGMRPRDYSKPLAEPLRGRWKLPAE